MILVNSISTCLDQHALDPHTLGDTEKPSCPPSWLLWGRASPYSSPCVFLTVFLPHALLELYKGTSGFNKPHTPPAPDAGGKERLFDHFFGVRVFHQLFTTSHSFFGCFRSEFPVAFKKCKLQELPVHCSLQGFIQVSSS